MAAPRNILLCGFLGAVLLTFIPFSSLRAEGFGTAAEDVPLPLGAGGQTVMILTPPTPSDSGLPSSVGIGMTEPQAKLDIDGGLRVGWEDCNADRTGMIAYNGSDLYLCTGAGWKKL